MKRTFTFFLALFCLSLPCRLYAQERETRELFSKAYAHFSQGELSQAEELFLKTLNENFLLNDYSLYFLGRISFSRGDLAGSRKYFTRLRQTFPHSVWSVKAELQLARLSLKEKNYQQALHELQTLRGRKDKKELSEESLHLLGQLHEAMGEPKRAHADYQQLRRSSPLSPWASAARKEVRRLRDLHPQLFDLTTPEALFEEGELLLREREYQEAEKVYRRILDLVPEGLERLRFLMGLATVYLRARRREEAIPVLSEILQDFPTSSEASHALYRLAEIYWNRDENLRALDLLTLLKERYPTSTHLDSAHIASARIYESLGKPAEALRLYQDFGKKFPNSQLREESQWRMAWIHYLEGDYERAHNAFKVAATDKGAASYWQARTAEKTERSEEAKRLYLQILNSQEDSYYKGPAAKRLEKLGVSFEEKKPPKPNPLPQAIPPLGPERSFHFSRAQELAEISLHQLAVAELDEIKNLSNKDLPLKLTLIREYAKNNAHDRSQALVSQIYHPSEELQRYRYPLAYWDTIRKKSEERALDPYLVLALIRQESLFDPKALSPASAFGLMQLLPSTAARAATALGLPPPSRQELYDPTLNLTLGIHHLKELLHRYSDNLVKAIAAYNAGDNAVARWERQIAVEDEEEFVERITYAETRLYVKLVLRNHRIYRLLYPAQQ